MVPNPDYKVDAPFFRIQNLPDSLRPLSVVNWRIIKMQHDSPFTCLLALWMADFGQRAQHRFYEVCAIPPLSLRKNRNLAFPCAIEENREHSFLMEM
jgi:hypothetical protein